MVSSSRALMSLLLLGSLGACDRQSQPKEQAGASGSDEVAATPGAGAAAGASGAAFSYKLDRSKAGTAAPDHAFLDPDGGEKTLQDFAGKPVLVNLWATWCTPCVAEMPTLNRIAQTYGPKGLTVLTISQDTQGLAAAKPFFAKQNLPLLKAYADPENHFGFDYATGSLPTSVLYGADGKEIVRVVGAMDWEISEAKSLIDAALQS